MFNSTLYIFLGDESRLEPFRVTYSLDKCSKFCAVVVSTHFRVPAASSEQLTGRKVIMLRVENLMAPADTDTRVVLYGFSGIG